MRPILITFYSYKGGVGRTQALAHMAVGLANRERDVVILDMDLESPGVHAFFSPDKDSGRRFTAADLAQYPGLLDFVEVCNAMPADEPDIVPLLIDCHHETLRRGRVRLLTPGRIDSGYSERLARFSWPRFYDERGGYQYMELLRDQLFSRAGADIVLVDSRTGLTDAGLICTFQLPEIVVTLFALHDQGIDGAGRMATALAARSSGSDSRLERILLVPSRVDEYGVPDEAQRWADAAARTLRDLPRTELFQDYGQRIPYYPKVAYGEHILDLEAEPNPLTTAYNHLLRRILALQGEATPEETTSREQRGGEPLWPAIQAAVAQIHQGIEALSNEAAALDIEALGISDISRRAHTMGYLAETLRARLDAIDALVGRFDRLTGAEPRPRYVPTPPSRLPGWKLLAASLSKDIGSMRDRIFDAIRVQLEDSSLHDERLLKGAWPDAERLLSRGSAEEIQEGLRELRERLNRQTLRALLQRRELKQDGLARRIPDESARRRWLDDRIQEEIERAVDDKSAALALWNLVELRIALLGPQESHGPIWNAYDILCLVFPVKRNDTDETRPTGTDLFREVGCPLWLSSWRRLFSAPPSERDVASPAESEAKAQLKDLDLDVLGPVIDAIQDGLRSWMGLQFDGFGALRALFRARRGDPCVRAAVEQVLQAHHEGPERLAAVFLLEAEGYEKTEQDALVCVLSSLLARDRAAESFYLLASCARMDPTLVASTRFDEVYVAFLATELKHWTPSSPILAVCQDAVWRARILSTRSGKALLAAVEGGFVKVPEQLTWAFQAESGASDVVPIRAAQAEIARIRELHIYPAWSPSAHYERKLRELIDTAQSAVLSTPRSPGAARPHPIDAKSWISATYRRLHDDVGARMSLPDGKAQERIYDLISKLNEALNTLWDLCPADGTTTLERVLQHANERERALAALRDSLSAPTTSIGAAACHAIDALLRVA